MEQLTNDGDYYFFNFYINMSMQPNKNYARDKNFVELIADLHEESGNFIYTLTSTTFIDKLYKTLVSRYEKNMEETNDDESILILERTIHKLKNDFKKRRPLPKNKKTLNIFELVDRNLR